MIKCVSSSAQMPPFIQDLRTNITSVITPCNTHTHRQLRMLHCERIQDLILRNSVILPVSHSVFRTANPLPFIQPLRSSRPSSFHRAISRFMGQNETA